MQKQDRPDFKKYTLPPVSRKYLLRIALYLLLLSLVAGIAIYSRGTHKKPDPADIEEINNLEIEMQGVELADSV